jgi:DNA helicase-2/ATP-dependent DNA helicase PcrA
MIGAGEKIGKMIELAEELYNRVSALQEQLQSTTETVDETAERAANRGLTTPGEWRTLARQIATARGEETAIPAVEQCIDRYFRTDLPSWTLLSAERRFELAVAGETVTGLIDAIYRTPDGDLVVIDYKATETRRSLDSGLQLPIYLMACRELLDEQPTEAGYAYVGPIGPGVETRTYSEGDLDAFRSELEAHVEAAANSSYADYTAGDHCEWCPHRSLSCSPFTVEPRTDR